MFRLLRKILLRVLLSLVLLVLLAGLVLNVPFTFLANPAPEGDYSAWMGETLALDRLVIDVAMPGAHDAFSSDVGLFSRVDALSASSIQTGFTGLLIKGFSAKQSRTQVSTATELLEAGIRYFDVRLTYNEKEAAWYTSHSYFSAEFAPILAEIETFLADHPAEFVFLDIQHVYGAEGRDDAFGEIRTLFADSGLLDRAYPDDLESLADVTYGDVTEGKTKGGILIFTKLENADPSFWSYGASIRSAWANTDDPQTCFDFLAAEADLIRSGDALTGNQMTENPEAADARGGLRVMQGVLTMQMNGSGILTAIGGWSLLNRAAAFNPELIAQADFADWLSAMPVVMVDYADSSHGDFLDFLMEILLQYNQQP